MRGIIGATRSLNANIPKNFLVVSDHLKKNGLKPISTPIRRSRIIANFDGTAVDGAAHVGEGGELFKGLGGFVETAATDGNFDEFGVKFGGEEASDHVGDLGDEVGFERVARGEGFGGEAVGEAREDHGDGVVRGEREVGEGDVGFELVDDGGENGIGEAVERSPLGVSKRGFHGPDVLGGECPEGGDGVVGSGRSSRWVGGGGGCGCGGGGGGRWARGGNIGKDRGDGEEQEWGGGGGGEKGGRGSGGSGSSGGGSGGVGEERGGGGIKVVVEVEEIRQH